MAKIIRLTKVNGEVQYQENVLSLVRNSFDTLANGVYILTIKRETKKRSLDQNALMWLWFTCISMETGTDKNDIHDYYCMLYLRRTVPVNGEDRVIISGTSKLTTLQFTDFLNKVQADAASEFGIRLPNPEDLHFEDFRSEYEKYIH